MIRHISLPFTLAVVVLVCSRLPVGMAAEPSTTDVVVSIQRVDVGFAGLFQVGRWTQLSAFIETDGPATIQLTVHVPDPEGSLASFPSEKFEIVSAGLHQLSTNFKSGRLDSDIQIEVTSEGRLLATKKLRPSSAEDGLQPALKQSVAIWATLGNPIGFGSSDYTETFDIGASSFESVSIARLNSTDELPREIQALDGLNSLIFNGHFNLDEQQNAALRDWVRAGGHLVLATGRHVTDYLNSPLAAWVPVSIGAAKPLRTRDVSGLELFAETNYRVPFSRNLIAAKLSVSEGETSIAGLDSALLVRVPYGFGKITVFALDLDQTSPLAKWKSITTACRKIVADEQEARNQKSSRGRRQLSHSGITELATQLHAVQEHFPDLHRFSSNQVLWMILAYLVVIGPIDYLVVHRLLQKPGFTWFTFPLMVTVAVVVTIGGATTANSSRLQMNQFDVIDIDEKTGFVRSQSWLNIYSPENQRYKVSVVPAAIDAANQPVRQMEGNNPAEAAVVWSGIPETVFGGMYRSGGFDLGRPGYRLGVAASSIENIPVSIWSTKPLTATWNYEAGSLVESNLTSSGLSQLSGSIIHRLPVPIEDWIVAYGDRVFRPRVEQNIEFAKMPPNLPWTPNAPQVHQRELRGFLTRAKVYKIAKKDGYGEDILIQQDRYDALDYDPTDLMRMITFHRAAGGTAYTGLENFALANFDLSRMLKLDRAILFGRVNLSAARLKLDEKFVEPTRRVAFVRILLPVKRVKSGPRILPELGEKRVKLQQTKEQNKK